MKKIYCLIPTFLLLMIAPMQSRTEHQVNSTTVIVSGTTESAEARVLITRLYEINNMDKENLSLPQKKELRNELRLMKSRLQSIGSGGVYISVGAIILIVVLLIILF